MINVFIPSFYEKVWEEAYFKGSYIIDCSKFPNPTIATNTIYFRCYRYRKAISKVKLNPNHTNEWSRLKRCGIRMLGKYRIQIYKKKDIIFTNNLNKYLADVPGVL